MFNFYFGFEKDENQNVLFPLILVFLFVSTWETVICHSETKRHEHTKSLLYENKRRSGPKMRQGSN